MADAINMMIKHSFQYFNIFRGTHLTVIDSFVCSTNNFVYCSENRLKVDIAPYSLVVKIFFDYSLK